MANVRLKVMPIFVFCLFVGAALLECRNAAARSVNVFRDIVLRGVVDVNYNPASQPNRAVIARELNELNPGIANRIGFQFGGETKAFLDNVRKLAHSIHELNPKMILGGAFNEALYPNYNQILPCGGSLGELQFEAKAMISDRNLSKAYLIDLSRDVSQVYYICLGQILIDSGIALLHFEAPSSVVAASSSSEAAIAGYKRVREALIKFAQARGTEIYFSGDVFLSNKISLESVYIASRFYHNIKIFDKYRNKIKRDGVGVGYSYVLSLSIVRDIVGRVPNNTIVMFYVDNWDKSQDDLRRMMELDSENRRFLLKQSAVAAVKYKAYFIPPIYHCWGCISADAVGDTCEVSTAGVSVYNASDCGDMQTVRSVLQLQK